MAYDTAILKRAYLSTSILHSFYLSIYLFTVSIYLPTYIPIYRLIDRSIYLVCLIFSRSFSDLSYAILSHTSHLVLPYLLYLILSYTK